MQVLLGSELLAVAPSGPIPDINSSTALSGQIVASVE
jgi:hypothetical protein